MSLFTSYSSLIHRGRKAGLTTRELYSAMASRPQAGASRTGQLDGNGFVASINPHGQRLFRPAGSYPRS